MKFVGGDGRTFMVSNDGKHATLLVGEDKSRTITIESFSEWSERVGYIGAADLTVGGTVKSAKVTVRGLGYGVKRYLWKNGCSLTVLSLRYCKVVLRYCVLNCKTANIQWKPNADVLNTAVKRLNEAYAPANIKFVREGGYFYNVTVPASAVGYKGTKPFLKLSSASNKLSKEPYKTMLSNALGKAQAGSLSKWTVYFVTECDYVNNDSDVLGQNPGPFCIVEKYNKGSGHDVNAVYTTLAHEAGHYFTLKHTHDEDARKEQVAASSRNNLMAQTSVRVSGSTRLSSCQVYSVHYRKKNWGVASNIKATVCPALPK